MRELRASSSVGWDHGGLQAGRVSVDMHLVVGLQWKQLLLCLATRKALMGVLSERALGKGNCSLGRGN